jgi:RNA polymerase sigma factor (sigma-70 family)
VAQTVLERIAAGDPAAVDECIDRYGALVWSLARRHLRQHADADDAVQEIFIEIWRSAARFDPVIASEATFITMISRRRLIDRQRKQSRTITTQSMVEEPAACSQTHEDRVDMEEESERARVFMGRNSRRSEFLTAFSRHEVNGSVRDEKIGKVMVIRNTVCTPMMVGQHTVIMIVETLSREVSAPAQKASVCRAISVRTGDGGENRRLPPNRYSASVRGVSWPDHRA